MSELPFARRRFLLLALGLGVALAVAAACGDGNGDGGTPSAAETPGAGETPAIVESPEAHEDESESATAEIQMLPVITFDRDELTIAADTSVTITADNTDGGIRHNFAIYSSRDAAESGEDSLAATEIHSGPFTDSATVNLTAGEYFFRCDVHPNQMAGTLTVE
jgi:plastocyanin